MHKLSMIAFVAALAATASFVSVADAQRDPRQRQAVQPFTEAERNWFEIPQGRELIPPSHRRPY
jgi:hypothetical protein